MARSDLLISLVRAGATGDKAMLRTAAEALIAEERAKSHTALADRLARALQSNGQASNAPVPVTQAHQVGRDFILETIPRQTIESLSLSQSVYKPISDLIEEQLRADLLRSHGLQPRHRILLSGPPGNGKTSLAEALAEKLTLPFFTVRYDALIGSYLGETTQRLRRLFDYIRTTPSVLLFDEFDSIGKERGDPHETGEIKRVVSSLLLQVDTLPSYVVVVGATNHAELLDRAVWRRFELRLEMPPPTLSELSAFIERLLAPIEGQGFEVADLSPGYIAKRLGLISYAEARDFCLDVYRQQVLSLGARNSREIIREQLDLWSSRLRPPQNADRSDKTTSKAARKPIRSQNGKRKQSSISRRTST